MKVLAINSSARKDGNTAILINRVFEELHKEGIETEMIQLLLVTGDVRGGFLLPAFGLRADAGRCGEGRGRAGNHACAGAEHGLFIESIEREVVT